MESDTRTSGWRLHLRSLGHAALDGLAWTMALFMAVWARYDFDASRFAVVDVLALAGIAALGQLLVGLVLLLYRGRYTYGSFDEVLGLTTTVLVVSGLLALVAISGVEAYTLPRSTPFLGAPLALLLMVAGRYTVRMCRERRLRPGPHAERVLVFGAGAAGVQLVQQMLREPEGRYIPAGLLDDDRGKRNLRVGGVRVLGGRGDVAFAAHNVGATALVLALPRADAGLIREIDDIAVACGLQMKVVPTLSELIGGRLRVSDVRDVDESDLMGRQPVDTDVASIAGYLTGRRVLVTGAGGSIGSELCRQISGFGPAELIMLDRDESALHAVQLSIYGRGLLDSRDVVLADIRDDDALRAIFEDRRPEVVFHAAALKHLPMLEQYPAEAWKINVLGTLNVLEAAAGAGVARFVNISTDKAANPTSVLGHSKRIAEQLTAWMAGETIGTFLSVRFGNVLGSRGSVLHAFRAQIESGGPVTVTHPDVTRFFMTIPEACQLVIQAAAIGGDGEALVLDMGEPVAIADIAHRLIVHSGKRVDIVYTGLREGEKLHEDLFGAGEQDERPLHPQISHVRVPAASPAQVQLRGLPGRRQPTTLYHDVVGGNR